MLILEIFIVLAVTIGIYMLISNNGKIAHSVKNRMDDAADKVNDAVRDPIADGAAAIREGRNNISLLNEQKRQLFRSNNLLKMKQTNLNSQVEKYEKLAQEEGKTGNRENVSLLVSKIKNAQLQLTAVDQELQKNEELVTTISTNIESLTSDVEHAEANKDHLTTRITYAKIREKIAVNANLGNATSDALQRLELDAQNAEADANSYEQIAGDPGDPVKAIERRHAATNVTDEEIAKYMSPPSKKVEATV